MSLDQLLDVQVISMSRTLEDWRTAPTAIGVLTAEDVRRSGAVRLADVLRLAPGIHVGRDTGSNYAINARGFSSAVGNKMEVLLDGRSLYTPLFAGVSWNVQDTLLEDISRIETVRGPGATLWGSNAVNGVINIVTKSTEATQGTLVTAGAGVEERAFAAVRHGGQLAPDVYYRVYVKRLDRDDLIRSDGLDAQDDLRHTQLGFRLDSLAATDQRFTLQGDWYAATSGLFAAPDAKYKGGNLLGRWTRDLTDGSQVQVQAYYDATVRDVPRQFYEARDTGALEAQYRFRLGERHHVIVGGNYRLSADDTGTGDAFSFVPKSRTIQLVGGFVQDEITLRPERWTLYLGSKFEHNDFTGFEAQPSARLAYHRDARQTLWASVSRAVRTPTRAEQDSRLRADPATELVLIGNRSFRAETLFATELGYRVQPRSDLFIDLATFRNHYNHLRTFEPTLPGPLPLILTNAREGVTYGGELVVTWQALPWWRLSGSYAYLHEDLKFKPGVIDPTLGALETNDAPHTVKLHSTMNLGAFEFDAALRYVDRLPNPPVASYTNLDLRLGWRPTREWQLALVLQNLFDASHPEFSGGGLPVEVQRCGYVQATLEF